MRVRRRRVPLYHDAALFMMRYSASAYERSCLLKRARHAAMLDY